MECVPFPLIPLIAHCVCVKPDKKKLLAAFSYRKVCAIYIPMCQSRVTTFGTLI